MKKTCPNTLCLAHGQDFAAELDNCGECNVALVTITVPAEAGETSIEKTHGVSEDEARALVDAIKAHDETETQPTPAASAAAPVVEAVPGPGDLVIPTPPPTPPAQPTTAHAAPTPVIQVLRTRPAPSADPAPTARPASTPADPGISPKLKAAIDNAAIVADLEAQRRAREARAQREAARPAPCPAANDDTEDTFFEPAARAPAPRAQRQPTSDLKVTTTNRSWLWLVAAAVVLIGVLGWWLLKDRNSNGGAPQPAIAASDDVAPASSVDMVARNMGRNALDGVDRLTTGLGKVNDRVTNLVNSQDGRRGLLIAESPTCEYPNFGACVETLLRSGDQRLVEQGIITPADAKASAERTCRATGCGGE